MIKGAESAATMPNICLVLFLLLAGTISAANTLGYAVSTGLFVSNVGSESIPLFYLILGLCSLPISLVGSRVIDRYSRIRLFQYLMMGAVIGLSLFHWKIQYYALPVYFLIHITVHVLDLLSGVLLWTLIAEYFTSRQLERHTPLIVMAMTIGGALGGVSVRLVSDVFSTPNLLFSVVLLDATLIAQLGLLQRLVRPDDRVSSPSEYLSLSNFKTVAKLLTEFPIITLLAIGMGLSVFLWGMSELQFFTIYSEEFSDQAELTGFLGLVSAGSNVLEFSMTYFVTLPLIRRWGVRWMNLVYPTTTLLSFVGLAMQFKLPSAIAAHLNYDTFYSSISQPIQNLNFNAVPPQFSGRVRLIIDGLLYPFCQAIAGGLLIAQQAIFTPLQISLSGVAISAIFIWVGYLTGRCYAGMPKSQI
jgi:hypothetical protein